MIGWLLSSVHFISRTSAARSGGKRNLSDWGSIDRKALCNSIVEDSVKLPLLKLGRELWRASNDSASFSASLLMSEFHMLVGGRLAAMPTHHNDSL